MTQIRMSVVQRFRWAYWRLIDGENNRRYQQELTPNSLVIDAGGYVGEWAANIRERYGCYITILEPQPALARACEKRFDADSGVRVLAAALGDKEGQAPIGVGIGAGIGEDGPMVRVLDAGHFIGAGDPVDLLKLNIEGGEYAVLERLLDTLAIQGVRTIQVQFHDIVGREDCAERRADISRRLALTHRREWCVPWVWEQWRRI